MNTSEWMPTCPLLSSLTNGSTNSTPSAILVSKSVVNPFRFSKYGAPSSLCGLVLNLTSPRLFGSKRILSLWPRLSQSPVLRDFSWSPLVLRAFAQNAELLGALSSPSFRFLSPHLRPSVSPPLAPTELHNVEPLLKPEQTDPIPGLLVLHIRRGDFADHCLNLAKWSSDWNGLNQFSTLPDKFRVPPPSGGWGETTEQNIQIYMQHCFPTVEQITDKVREVLQDQYKSPRSTHELKRVYVMSNGDEAWLRKLKEALLEIKRWDAVVTSRDLRLSWEAKPIAQAVDMLIGQRAQVFIGNGVRDFPVTFGAQADQR